MLLGKLNGKAGLLNDDFNILGQGDCILFPSSGYYTILISYVCQMTNDVSAKRNSTKVYLTISGLSDK